MKRNQTPIVLFEMMVLRTVLYQNNIFQKIQGNFLKPWVNFLFLFVKQEHDVSAHYVIKLNMLWQGPNYKRYRLVKKESNKIKRLKK